MTTKIKVAFVGTSCAGKTTAAYGLISRLKTYGVLADGVISQDRKFSFDKALLDTSELAQAWMVHNLIAKEIELFLHADIEILVGDRSPLDLLAYYKYQYPASRMMDSLQEYVLSYLPTYSALYYLPPLPYQADGKRPSDGFRLGVDKELLDLISMVELAHPGLVQVLPRNKILEHSMRALGVKKPGAKTTLTREECQHVATRCNTTFYVKHSYFEKTDSDIFSDVDIMLSDVGVATMIKRVVADNFGPWVSVDVVPIDPALSVSPDLFTKFSA